MPDTSSAVDKVVLHAGCGMWRSDGLHERYRSPEWREVRLDIEPGVKPDIVASMTDMSAVQDASVDAVWSSHALEHLYDYEVPIALAEFYRVLKVGGHTLLRLPDLQKAAQLLLKLGAKGIAYNSPSGPITPLDMIFGHRETIRTGAQWMVHKTGFTQDSVETLLKDAGFKDIKVIRRKVDLWAMGKRL